MFIPARLSEKERAVVAGVRAGQKNREIATSIGTTEQVVKNCLYRVYERLGVKDRYGLIIYCVDVEQGKGFDPHAVKRYDLNPHDGEAGMELSVDGAYVEHEDFNKLLLAYEEALIEINRRHPERTR